MHYERGLHIHVYTRQVILCERGLHTLVKIMHYERGLHTFALVKVIHYERRTPHVYTRQVMHYERGLHTLHS